MQSQLFENISNLYLYSNMSHCTTKNDFFYHQNMLSYKNSYLITKFKNILYKEFICITFWSSCPFE